MFEVVPATLKLAVVVAAVIQVEYVIASLVEKRGHIADPTVVPRRGPILNGRGVGRLGPLPCGRDCREINGRSLDIIPLQFPGGFWRPLRIAKREVVVQQFAVHIHRPAHAGEIEDDFVFAIRPLEQGERNADGQILPVGMLAGMEDEIRLEHGHRTVGHFERRIILPLAVPRILLAKTDAQHIRYFQQVLLALELSQGHREFDREAVGWIRWRRELRLRSLGVSVLCAG